MRLSGWSPGGISRKSIYPFLSIESFRKSNGFWEMREFKKEKLHFRMMSEEIISLFSFLIWQLFKILFFKLQTVVIFCLLGLTSYFGPLHSITKFRLANHQTITSRNVQRYSCLSHGLNTKIDYLSNRLLTIWFSFLLLRSFIFFFSNSRLAAYLF